jgi:hypothetical protein
MAEEKWQSALLVQMRTEKIGLRDYLWRRRVPEFDNPRCGCGERRQTVAHILRGGHWSWQHDEEECAVT